jgi:hypothetical protein
MKKWPIGGPASYHMTCLLQSTVLLKWMSCFQCHNINSVFRRDSTAHGILSLKPTSLALMLVQSIDHTGHECLIYTKP